MNFRILQVDPGEDSGIPAGTLPLADERAVNNVTHDDEIYNQSGPNGADYKSSVQEAVQEAVQEVTEPMMDVTTFRPQTVSVYQKVITIDELRKYFHLPIAEVAKLLGTCTTALKKTCRKLNIEKWPHRQILSLTKSIQSLEMASLNDTLEDKLREQYKEQIVLLQKVIGEVFRNPNTPINRNKLDDLADAVANGTAVDNLRSVSASVYTPATADQGVLEQRFEEKSASKAVATPTEEDNIREPPPDPLDAEIQQLIANALEAAQRMPTYPTPSDRSRISEPVLKSDSGSKRKFGSIAEKDRTAISTDALAANSLNSRVERSKSLKSFPKVSLGNTSLKLLQFDDSATNWQFEGPVVLPALQRKRFRVNSSSRRVVPLMEPDIGSNGAVEFVPPTIITAFRHSMQEQDSPTSAVIAGTSQQSISGGHNASSSTSSQDRHLTYPSEQQHIPKPVVVESRDHYSSTMDEYPYHHQLGGSVAGDFDSFDGFDGAGDEDLLYLVPDSPSHRSVAQDPSRYFGGMSRPDETSLSSFRGHHDSTVQRRRKPLRDDNVSALVQPKGKLDRLMMMDGYDGLDDNNNYNGALTERQQAAILRVVAQGADFYDLDDDQED